jgi:hypothetical protein
MRVEARGDSAILVDPGSANSARFNGSSVDKAVAPGETCEIRIAGFGGCLAAQRRTGDYRKRNCADAQNQAA